MYQKCFLLKNNLNLHLHSWQLLSSSPSEQSSLDNQVCQL